MNGISTIDLDRIDLDQINLDQVAADLSSGSWAVCKNFLSLAECEGLVTDIENLRHAQHMHRAGVGSADRYQQNTLVRSDAIFWLEEAALTTAQHIAWDRLQTLRTTLNRHLYLGLRDLEAHLTHYAPNGHYSKHVDNFQGKSSRILSCIVYLNLDWNPGDGGELRLFAPDDEEKLIAEVAPRAGTLACFLSRDIPHEVTTTAKDRFSLTGWFR